MTDISEIQHARFFYIQKANKIAKRFYIQKGKTLCKKQHIFRYVFIYKKPDTSR